MSKKCQSTQMKLAALYFIIGMITFSCIFADSLWAVGQTKRLIISFSKDPNTYLPIENDLITVNATTDPIEAGVVVTFTLTQSYQFTFSDGTTTPKTATTDSSGVASVTIKSVTYYGVAKVAVTATNYTGDEKQIPVDSDNDTIADSWEQNHGGTAPNYLDPNADDETVTGITQTGDGFIVLNEYKGYINVGQPHSRTKPTEKGVFYHVNSSATGAAFAESGLSSLGLTVIKPPSGNTVNFLGDQERKRINALKSSIFGDLYDGDVYNSNGTSKGDTDIIFGKATLGGYIASPTPGNPEPWNAIVYETTIWNFYNLNKVSETVQQDFFLRFWHSTGYVTYRASFTGQDLNGNGNNTDLLNVFDLMSPSGQPNSAIDDIIATVNQSQLLNRTARHETGHVVYIDHPSDPPASGTGETVMAPFSGPGLVDIFTSTDKSQVRLK